MEESTEDILYHYYFEGVDKPVVVLAPNKIKAREMMATFIGENGKDPRYREQNIYQETSSRPMTGITSILINNQPHVWVGRSVTPSGWMEKTAYGKYLTGEKTDPKKENSH